MDILSPNLLWIKNRCYRINPGQENTDVIETSSADTESRNPYVEEGISKSISKKKVVELKL